MIVVIYQFIVGFFSLPAKLNALKNDEVISARADVSSPKSVKKSPNISPNEGITPKATTYNIYNLN